MDTSKEAQVVRRFIESDLRPSVRVDGGDITFESLEQDTVVLVAHADCAVCPAVTDCLRLWSESRLIDLLGRHVEVEIRRQPAYYQLM